jgi:hypothetical protein
LHHPSIKALDQSTIAPDPCHDDRGRLADTVHRFNQRSEATPGVDGKSAKAAGIIRRSKAKGFVLVGDKLYKHGSATGILMKCVPLEEGKEILQEIHKGVCGNHAASRTLVGKAFR